MKTEETGMNIKIKKTMKHEHETKARVQNLSHVNRHTNYIKYLDLEKLQRNKEDIKLWGKIVYKLTKNT